MFLRKKIGAGATPRRRPSCECKPGVEGLDTRAVPAVLLSLPGSPLVESGLPTFLNVSFDENGHGSASVSPVFGLPGTTSQLPSNLVAGAPTAVPGVVGNGTLNPLTLAYRLPTAVQPGDVAVREFQTGAVSDVLRFTDSFDPATGTLTGWLLVYSDNTDGVDSPADVSGIPANFNPFAFLTQNAIEFGVEGFNTIEYAGEQATYSGLSDGNVVFGTP